MEKNTAERHSVSLLPLEETYQNKRGDVELVKCYDMKRTKTSAWARRSGFASTNKNSISWKLCIKVLTFFSLGCWRFKPYIQPWGGGCLDLNIQPNGCRLCYKRQGATFGGVTRASGLWATGDNMQTSDYLWLVPGDRDSTWGSFCLKERIPTNYTKAHIFTGTLKHHLSVHVVHCSLLET